MICCNDVEGEGRHSDTAMVWGACSIAMEFLVFDKVLQGSMKSAEFLSMTAKRP